ncbi:MAG: type II toxin-antitoxin system HigB family toxin [Rhodospirillales bacterium]|nr:type II toxin-antitoxin system HigB family toxin [Rhodospirillales bacterium]
MHVIKKKTLKEFWEHHPNSEQPLKAWYREAARARWGSWTEIKALHRSASVLKNNRVVFNINGNQYRLIIKFSFKYQIAYVRFIGTHADYDRIDADTV